MRTISIFLASSSELTKDRQKFEILINKKNKTLKDKGIFIQLETWENSIDALSPTRLQDEYNKTVRGCDIFVMLFFTKVGPYTEEEFDVAFGQFKKTKKPLIFTYFKNAKIRTGNWPESDALSLFAFQKKLRELGHFHSEYHNIEGLMLQFWQQLDRLFEIYPYRENEEGEETLNISQSDDSPKIFVSKLPDAGGKLFGREKELEILDQAWANALPNIIQFIAWGGVGKTSLIKNWLNSLATNNYLGAKRVYAWSFYSQGSSEQRQSSAEQFIEHALQWFGETSRRQSAHDRGVLLAEAIRRQRTLLILDGLEPLQYPVGEMAGRLKDYGLRAMLKELAAHNPGLCLITSRIEVKDIADSDGITTHAEYLEGLTNTIGAQLLKYLGVKGTQKDLEQTSKDFNGHALTLRLLGNYLSVLHKGDIRHRDMIEKLTEEEQGGTHAKKVMEAYVKWFSGNKEKPGFLSRILRRKEIVSPEISILYLIGLFDRPAPVDALDALFSQSKLRAVTMSIRSLPTEKQSNVLNHLSNLGLLMKNGEDSKIVKSVYTNLQGFNGIESIDSHPLVREFFGDKFQKDYPEEWLAAHNTLYNYYRNVPVDPMPDTLEAMEPLFQAVTHGCMAKRYQHVLNSIYWNRITRGEEDYCVKKIGAFGSDLTALSNFFEHLWDTPAKSIVDEDKAAILSRAGTCLRALGRISDAVEPFNKGLEMYVILENWKKAAQNASNLCDLFLVAGHITKALEYGKKSIEYADNSDDYFYKVVCRATYANSLFQAGDRTSALTLFIEAEEIERNYHKEHFCLDSLQGFWYCQLLLALGKRDQADERADQMLAWANKSKILLDFALANLCKANVCLTWHQRFPNYEHFVIKAGFLLERAVNGLRSAGDQQFLPLGLLSRASWHRINGIYRMINKNFNKLEGNYFEEVEKDYNDILHETSLGKEIDGYEFIKIRNKYLNEIKEKDFMEANKDLEEIREIASISNMKIHMADYHLESARLKFSQNDKTGAIHHTQEAENLIYETGYYRRLGQLEELKGRLNL